MKKTKILSKIMAVVLCSVNIGVTAIAAETTDVSKHIEVESETQMITEAEAESETEITTNTEAESETEITTNTEAESETEITTNMETESEVESNTETTTDIEAESEIEITTETETETESTTDTEAESETETQSNTEMITETEPDTETDIITDCESETDITDEDFDNTKGINEDGSLNVNKLNFPDDIFREYLLVNFDKNADNIFSVEELQSIIKIDLSEYSYAKSLSDITGIEYFYHLESLNCIGLNLSKLDISKNIVLTYLSCGDNSLTSLDLSNNIDLTELYCFSNKLEELDLSKNTSLKYISCGDNLLKSLDITSNTALLELHCYKNDLTSLDISKNTALTYLYCNENELITIDTSKNSTLTQLSCSHNKITNLDLSSNSELAVLICDNNMLTALDVSKNSKLTDLFCGKNQLTTIDVKNNTELRQLYFGNNQIAEIDVSNNKNLESFDATNNRLTRLDLSNNTMLQSVMCNANEITIINLRNCERKFYTLIVPDTSTVYCHPDTKLEQYCITKNIQYKTEEPPAQEDKEPDKPSDDDLETEPNLYDLSNATVTCANTYLKVKTDNKGQLPKNIKVIIDTKTLKKNKDYTITYYKSGNEVKKLTTAGVYDMTITGIGDYTGKKTIQITVTERKLLSGATVKTKKVQYTGKPIKDGVIISVKHGNKKLEEGKDYTAEYTNNIDSGKGTIILKATKNSDYDGYKTVQFSITGVNMSKIKVKGVSAKEFNGTGGIEQNLDDIILTYTYKNKETKEKETTTLILGKDYDVTYKNNDKAGTAKIVFTGRGLYNGVLNKSFKINKVKLTNNMLDSSNIVAYMDKKGAKPDVKLSYNGIQLVKGKDYKLSYSNNKKATTDERKAKITITGKGSYKGTLYTTFDILPKSISDETIAIKTTEVQFDPDSKTNTYTTKAKVYDNGVALKVNKDYIVKPSENKITSLPAQGYTTGTVIIEGLGDYCGTRMAEFKIVTRLLSDSAIKVKIKGKYYYFGLPVTLEQKDIIVTDSKNKNKQLDASEYKITGYQNNNSAGTASVTIKGLGKYGGSRTITYTINYANTEKTKEVINLVNKERTARGLSELKMNQKLMYAAMIRAEEISESFSHTRPDGTSCFTIFEDLNIDYYGAGENIAYGYVSPEAVMTGWMNSPGHKANILTGSFTEIGVGCFEKNGRLYWVQMFITAP